MAQNVIIRGVTYTGVEKLSLPVSGGSALFRDTSDADAAASDVLSGKKAYNANGEINGGMTNQGAVSGAISDKDTPFQIPQGYHNGNGIVEIAAAQKALLIPGNIRDSVTILGVTGNYTGGGGGGPTSADAILIVRAPTGSIVTATKGGATLSPTLWTTAADANFECALFVIGSSLFDAQNSWTVTATLGSDSVSETVIIDDNKEYDLALSYAIDLWNNGDNYSVSGGWQFGARSGNSSTRAITSTALESYSTNNYTYTFFQPKNIQTISKNTLRATITGATINSSGDNKNIAVGLTSSLRTASSGGETSDWRTFQSVSAAFEAGLYATVTAASNETVSLSCDVSNALGLQYYVGLLFGNASGACVRVWFE